MVQKADVYLKLPEIALGMLTEPLLAFRQLLELESAQIVYFASGTECCPDRSTELVAASFQFHGQIQPLCEI